MVLLSPDYLTTVQYERNNFRISIFSQFKSANFWIMFGFCPRQMVFVKFAFNFREIIISENLFGNDRMWRKPMEKTKNPIIAEQTLKFIIENNCKSYDSHLTCGSETNKFRHMKMKFRVKFIDYTAQKLANSHISSSDKHWSEWLYVVNSCNLLLFSAKTAWDSVIIDEFHHWNCIHGLR